MSSPCKGQVPDLAFLPLLCYYYMGHGSVRTARKQRNTRRLQSIVNTNRGEMPATGQGIPGLLGG